MVQSRLKEIQTFAHPELIPGPVWLACRLLPKWYRTWDQCTLEVNLGNEDVLIPDCWYVPDKLRTGASNLGSVARGTRVPLPIPGLLEI